MAGKSPAWQGLYKPLSTTRAQIRLLELHPAEKLDDRVICRLITKPLDDQTEFIAVSSLWGDMTVTENIEVNFERFPVTTNIANALRYIRAVFLPAVTAAEVAKKRPKWLAKAMRLTRTAFDPDNLIPGQVTEKPPRLLVWVDAVCINQLDALEKRQQTILHSQIYHYARMVVGWLGLKDEMSDIALHYLWDIDEALPPTWGEIGDERAHPEQYAPKHEWMIAYRARALEHNEWSATHEGWVALRAFLDREYWTRCWILDEMTSARFPSFLIGSTIIPWKTILRLVQLIEELRDHPSDVFPPDMRAKMRGLPLSMVHTLLTDLNKMKRMNDAETHSFIQSTRRGSKTSSSGRSGSRWS